VRDGPDLHAEQAGDDQVEPDAPEPEHRVLLVRPAALGEYPPLLGRGLVALQGDLDRQVGEVGQELVQRRGRSMLIGAPIARLATVITIGSPSPAAL